MIDVAITGSGPNALAAAIALARAGLHVEVFEARATIGGAARTEELTLPGFRHDVCSAIHPMSLISPFIKTLPLAEYGLQWVEPPFALAHPLDNGSAAVLEPSLDATAARLGPDGIPYHALFTSLTRHHEALFDEILRPIRLLPRHPLLLARFALDGLRPARALAKTMFSTEEARALFGGCAAHSFLPLDEWGSASFAIVLAVAAHAAHWPCARGGSQAIVDAMASYLRTLGGAITTSHRVSSLSDLPEARAYLFDVTPRQLVAIAGDELPRSFARTMRRFQYGPGVFKIDWALSQPIPWTNRDCAKAATVHVGGGIDDFAPHEAAVWRGAVTERPMVLVAQQSLFDDTRAPAGKHTGWAYCHVPNGSTLDMTQVIERQIERFAPGFRDCILARHTRNCVEYEQYNANIIGGDIGGGANRMQQVFARPRLAVDPYATPNPRIFIGSSSTPPGGGVHGMCGYWAAQSVLRRLSV